MGDRYAADEFERYVADVYGKSPYVEFRGGQVSPQRKLCPCCRRVMYGKRLLTTVCASCFGEVSRGFQEAVEAGKASAEQPVRLDVRPADRRAASTFEGRMPSTPDGTVAAGASKLAASQTVHQTANPAATPSVTPAVTPAAAAAAASSPPLHPPDDAASGLSQPALAALPNASLLHAPLHSGANALQMDPTAAAAAAATAAAATAAATAAVHFPLCADPAAAERVAALHAAEAAADALIEADHRSPSKPIEGAWASRTGEAALIEADQGWHVRAMGSARAGGDCISVAASVASGAIIELEAALQASEAAETDAERRAAELQQRLHLADARHESMRGELLRSEELMRAMQHQLVELQGRLGALEGERRSGITLRMEAMAAKSVVGTSHRGPGGLRDASDLDEDETEKWTLRPGSAASPPILASARAWAVGTQRYGAKGHYRASRETRRTRRAIRHAHQVVPNEHVHFGRCVQSFTCARSRLRVGASTIY